MPPVKKNHRPASTPMTQPHAARKSPIVTAIGTLSPRRTATRDGCAAGSRAGGTSRVLDPAARQGDGLTRCPRLERNVHGPIALLEAEGQDVVIAAYRASVIHDLLGSLLGDGLDPASEPVHGRRLYCRAASTHTAAMMDAAIPQMR